jgi:transposase
MVGYDAGWFRNALAERGIVACIPSKTNRKIPIYHDRALYRQSHKVENMFGRLKDWRRIHTRYDRCAHTFFSAICIAATVIFWINQCVLTLSDLSDNPQPAPNKRRSRPWVLRARCSW